MGFRSQKVLSGARQSTSIGFPDRAEDEGSPYSLPNPDEPERHNPPFSWQEHTMTVDSAISSYEEAERAFQQGLLLFRQGDLPAAEKHFRAALILLPDAAAIHGALANLLTADGRLEEAEEQFRKALSIDPLHHQILNNLGCLLERRGRLDEAASCYRMAAAACADYPEARLNLGQLLHRCGQNDEAEGWYREATKLRPGYRDAHFGLGLLLKNRHRFDEAETQYRAALKADPHFFPGLTNLGIVLRTTGRLREALDCYRAALTAAPDNIQSWQNFLFLLSYLPDFDERNTFNEHRRFGEKFGGLSHRSSEKKCNIGNSQRPLRIGFVSGDFREHPVNRLFAPVLLSHDRENFLMICYSNVLYPDKATGELRGLADGWRDISRLTDDEAASLVREDRIDILVDLAGHTAGNRILIFTRKPAPVQAGWLGYWNSSGLSAIDFIISDRVTTPDDTTQLFMEQVVRLPCTRFCWEGIPSAPSPSPPPCVENGYVTFGCFNNLTKINDRVILLWTQILLRLPGSRLVLKSVAFDDNACRQRLLNQFAAGGVTGGRLTLLPISGHEEMLCQYSLIDIALDTFPFPGGITTMEALWMGVPVIGLSGSSMIGRQVDSLLTAAGLPQFIAADADGYLKVASTLAGDVERLVALRQTLRRQLAGSPLMNAEGFTRDLEGAFVGMWLSHSQGSSVG